MDKTISVKEENLIISKFRELSEDRKQKLLNYVETLYHKEPTSEGKKALQELFSGIFECDKEIAEKHDIYLYGVNTTK